jgi:hypothetical protein
VRKVDQGCNSPWPLRGAHTLLQCRNSTVTFKTFLVSRNDHALVERVTIEMFRQQAAQITKIQWRIQAFCGEFQLGFRENSRKTITYRAPCAIPKNRVPVKKPFLTYHSKSNWGLSREL